MCLVLFIDLLLLPVHFGKNQKNKMVRCCSLLRSLLINNYSITAFANHGRIQVRKTGSETETESIFRNFLRKIA